MQFWAKSTLIVIFAAFLGAAEDNTFAQSLSGGNVRVSTHDLFPADPFVASSLPPDVLQQNEPSIAVHPVFPNLIAVGMNDVRTLAISGDSWQGLSVSTNGGTSFDFEAIVPGFLGDTSAAGLASPVHGNHAASDPWLSFDKFNHLFFAFVAFQRTPPGRPGFSPQDVNAIAVAKYNVVFSGGVPTGVAYDKTVVIERGTVGLGRQEDKDALTVDDTGSQFDGNIYTCWARFSGSSSRLKVARSTDHGESFTIAELFAAPGIQGCNLTVAPNGDVYVSWRTLDKNPTRNSNPQANAIFVARSIDGGRTFGPAIRVATFDDYIQLASRTPPVFRVSSDSFLAADANGLYVAWTQKNAGTGADVMISRSTDGGRTWESPVTPHTFYGHQLMPFLAAAGGKLSVVWFDSRSEPAFNPDGPVSGQCPASATTGAGCIGMDVFYNQANTSAAGPLSFGAELRITAQSFNPNLYGSIKALTPFIGDYTGVVANASNAYVAWTDNRDMNPSANALEDNDATTDPPSLINARSRDSNIYFQKISK